MGKFHRLTLPIDSSFSPSCDIYFVLCCGADCVYARLVVLLTDRQ